MAVKLKFLSTILFSQVLIACSSTGTGKLNQTLNLGHDKATWFTYVYAPRYYDAYLISGQNYMYDQEDATDGLRFWENPGGGWRSTGVMASGGTVEKATKIPFGVQLTWRSQTENKYYQVRIPFPREKMAALMGQKVKTDFSLKGNTTQMDNIAFALAPGGFVSVRLGGGKTVEIATAQAKQIHMPWQNFAASQQFNGNKLLESEFSKDHYKSLPARIQKQVDEQEFPVNRWKEYSEQRFPWHFSSKMDIAGVRIMNVNGEGAFYDKADLADLAKGTQAAPAWIKVFYKENNQRFVATLRLSKQSGLEQPEEDLSIFEIFKQFFRSNPSAAVLELSKNTNDFDIYLINASRKQKLEIFHQDISKISPIQYPWFK